MGDLISRSAVINLLNELRVNNISLNDKRLTEYINELPTAYNVEKVVAELEKVRMNYFLTIANTGSDKLDFAYANVCTALDKVIDIVKRGGIDERT